MAKPSKALDFLISQAEKQLDDANRRLGKTQQAVQSAQNQLHMLDNFRLDYQNRGDQRQKQGILVSELNNQYKFLGTLDSAYQQQNNIVGQQKSNLEMAKRNWQLAQQKLNSFKVLRERRLAVEQAKADRVERKQLDEMAAQVFRLRQQAESE